MFLCAWHCYFTEQPGCVCHWWPESCFYPHGTQITFGRVCPDVATVMSEMINICTRISTDIVWHYEHSLSWWCLSVVQCATCTLSNIFLFSLLLQHKFSPVLFDLPSVFLVLELKTFKQWRVDWMQVKGDHWFSFLQDQTSCCLWCSFTTCMHNIFSVFCSFPICLTLFGLFFFIWFLSWYFFPIFHFFDIFCHFFFFSFFSSLISPSLPFLHHRSGCSCGTRQGRSVFVASSRVTSETLLLQL